LLSRFGIIGDVHAEDQRLALALDFFEGQALDAILCVGDIADGRGSLSETCRLLQEHNVSSVSGNHDRWFRGNQLRDLPHASRIESADGRSRAYLASLPSTRRFKTAGRDVLLCHGVDDDDMETLYAHDDGYELEVKTALHRVMAMPDVGYMVGGHTHARMVRTFGPLTVINAGTLAGEAPCIGVVDLSEGYVTFLDLIGHRVLTTDVISLSPSSA
jgi:predicted phosphodiesterase